MYVRIKVSKKFLRRMARKSSFTIRAQKRIRYTDAEKQKADVSEICVWVRRDGTYAKFKRDGEYKLPNRGSGRTNISQADRNKITRPKGYYRYSAAANIKSALGFLSLSLFLSFLSSKLRSKRVRAIFKWTNIACFPFLKLISPPFLRARSP